MNNNHENLLIPRINPENSCPFALCRCKAPKPADIAFYFKGLATKQMCKDNGKHYPPIWVNKKMDCSKLKDLFIVFYVDPIILR
jgi:hypothetical protein